MKFPIFILFVGAVAAGIAVVTTFASAPTYGLLFLLGTVAGVAAIGCVVYLYYVGLGWFLAGLVPGILALYAIGDIIFRNFAGVRVLDIFK